MTRPDETNSASIPPTLDYRASERRPLSHALSRPMPWSLASLCFGIATWPFWWMLCSPTLLYIRPMIHLVVGSISCGVALAAWCITMLAIGRHSTALTVDASKQAWRRFALTFGASVGFIALHATAVPLNVLFALHRPWFEAARQNALSTLSPDQTLPHRSIGFFDVRRVRRSHDGEIGFEVDGCSIYFDPTPSTPDCVFYPPGNGGRLVGGWRWEATD